MNRSTVLCIDDQKEVLSSILRELEGLGNSCEIIDCESAQQAAKFIGEFQKNGYPLPLIITDHIMPAQTGIDFLIENRHCLQKMKTKKILITGQASHQETILAINKARIDHYIAKPWKNGDLLKASKILLNEWFLENRHELELFSHD